MNSQAMSVDEVMSDAEPSGSARLDQSSVDTGAPRRGASKNGITPSGSSDDVPSWNTKKFREECASLKSRMTDGHFSVADFPDPLRPRQAPLKKPLSEDSAETIRQLYELVAKIRAEQS